MIVVVESMVEGLDVADEHILFPRLSSLRREVVIVQKEGNLQASGLDGALGALVLPRRDAAETTEDGELQDGYSDAIEADAVRLTFFSNTLRRQLDVTFLEARQVGLPVLQGRRNDAAFASDRLVAEVIDGVLFSIHFGLALLNAHLQVVEHLKVWLFENVSMLVYTVARNWREPERVDAEEGTEFVLEVLLLNVSARSRRHPELLRVRRELVIHEAQRAEHQEHKSTEDKMAWVAARHFSQTERKLFKHPFLILYLCVL